MWKLSGTIYYQHQSRRLSELDQLVWHEAFAIEWAPTPSGPWRSDWHDLNGIVTTNQESTVRLSMFFPVKQQFAPTCMRGTWICSDSSLTNAQYVMIDEAGIISARGFYRVKLAE